MFRRAHALCVLTGVLACLLGNLAPANAQTTPVIQTVPDQANYELDTITPVTLSLTDPDHLAAGIQVYNLPDGLTYDAATRTISGTITYYAEVGAGTDPRVISAAPTDADGVALSWMHFTWSVTGVDAPPTATVSPTLSRDSNGAYLVSTPRNVAISPITIAAVDPDPCDAPRFELPTGQTYPPGISVGPVDYGANPTCTPGFVWNGVLSGTPTTEGTYTFTVQNNVPGQPLATFIWTVTNSTPQVTTITDQTATTASSFSLTATGTDENSDVLTFSATGLPNGLVLNRGTGTISGTPLATGTYTVGVQALDGHGGVGSTSFALAVTGTSTTPSCTPDASGHRPPGLWCSGDAFVGIGVEKMETTTDENGNPSYIYPLLHAGEYKQLDAYGHTLGASLFDSALDHTNACVVDRSGDLWTAGADIISHFKAPTATLAAELQAPIDISSHVSTPMCGTIAAFPWFGCGRATSVTLDAAGNVYVGTDYGTNQILKYTSTGTFVTAYTVPAGAQGPNWIDLAADQQTMFYTSKDGIVRVFRLDGQPLAASLFAAGVQHLADEDLDPDNAGLFGQIVVADNSGNPLGSPLERVRVLPPGDGSGGLLVNYSMIAQRIDLAGAIVQEYPSIGTMQPLWNFEIAPDGKSVWLVTAANADWSEPTQVARWHMPTNTGLLEPETDTSWSAADALCVKDAYIAAVTQPDCVTDPTNSLCMPVVICPDESADCVPPNSPQFTVPADRTDHEGTTITPFTLTATDPEGRPLTYSVGPLPEGITFDTTTHTFSGTVGWHAADGSYGYTRIDVTNDHGLLTRKQFNWTVINEDAPPSVTVSPTLARDGSGNYLVSTPHGVAISTLTLSGNDPDACDQVNFYLHSGTSLPPGISLTPAGDTNPTCSGNYVYHATLTGTPTTDGSTTFTIESDSSHPLATFIWAVTNTVPVLTVPASQTLNVGQSLSVSASATDANGDALTFSASNLPAGLAINSVTGAISGTTTAAGRRSVLVSVNDGHGAITSLAFTISVIDPSDTTPPTITTSILPAPNAAGWNRSPVTISFTCNDSGSGVATCPAPVTVGTSGVGQEISGTAVDNGGNSTSVTVTVNVDLLPPTVSLTSPSGDETTDTPTVTLAGTVTDSVSGVVSAACNGTPATIVSGSVSCTMNLQPGMNALMVTAIDAAGNSASASVNKTLAGTPTQLSVVPGTRTMTVGEQLALSVFDEFGRVFLSSAWGSSDIVVAGVDSNGVVTGLVPGTATITASSGSLSATLSLTVVPAGPMSLGTTLWTIDPLPGLYHLETVSTQSADTSSFAILDTTWVDGADGFGGFSNPIVRGFSTEGTQTYQMSAGLALGDRIHQTIGSPNGGLTFLVEREATSLAEWNTMNANGGSEFSLVHTDPTHPDSGWRTRLGYQDQLSTPLDDNTLLVSQAADGTIFAPSTDGRGIVGIDGQSGAVKFTVNPPIQAGLHIRYVARTWSDYPNGGVNFPTYGLLRPCAVLNEDYPSPSGMTGGRIDANGKANYLITSGENTFYYISQFESCVNPTDTLSVGNHATVQLMRVDVSGGVELTTLEDSGSNSNELNETDAAFNGLDALPDDAGGDVVRWDSCHSSCSTVASYVSADNVVGTPYSMDARPILSASNSVGYSDTGGGTLAFDMKTGQNLWSADGPPLAAMQEGGLLTALPGGLLTLRGANGDVTESDLPPVAPIVKARNAWIGGDSAVITTVKYLDPGGTFLLSNGSGSNANAPALFNSNYNALDIFTTAPLDFVWDNIIRTFTGVNHGDVATARISPNPLSISAVGDDVQFTLSGLPGFLQPPFDVAISRIDAATHTAVALTAPNHPLFGARYWRVFQLAAGHIVLETGAIDIPNVLSPNGLPNFIGFLFTKNTQLRIWEEYLNYAVQVIHDAYGGDGGDDPNYAPYLPGRWDEGKKLYNMTNICGHAPGPHGTCSQ